MAWIAYRQETVAFQREGEAYANYTATKFIEDIDFGQTPNDESKDVPWKLSHSGVQLVRPEWLGEFSTLEDCAEAIERHSLECLDR